MNKHPLHNLGLEAMFLLNLVRRTERRVHAEAQFKSIGLTGVKHWPAVDANALGLKSKLQDITPGMIGCYKSHREIMKHCLDNYIDSYIVFEDDIMFIPGFTEFAELAIEQIPADWEFVYWGCTEHLNGEPLKHVNDFWAIPNSVWGTQCFMVRGHKTIQKLYDALAEMIMQIDCQLSQIVLKGQKIKHYSVYPIAVGQLYEIGSDVQKRNPEQTIK